jgi:hypothetical protein
MVPKKYKELIEPTAKQLNLPVDLVDSFVRFYYKELRMTLSGMKAPLVAVDGIGKFRMKHWNELEVNIKKGLENVDMMKFQGFDRKAVMDKKLQQIAQMRELVAAEKQRYEEHKIKRYGKKMDTDS